MIKRLSLFFVVALVVAVPATSWAQKGKIEIAVQGPLSGEQSAFGEHIKLGAHLAVEESVKAFKAMGYDLVLVPYDDQAKPEVGVANARYLVADPDVLVLVGHYNSGVALPASEVYKESMLAMISPANTATESTDGRYPNVNRVCGRDDVQDPVGARFAAQDLNLKSVYIIHDKTLAGQGAAAIFRNEAKKLGLNVLGYEGTEEHVNFSPMIIPLIIPLKAKDPGLVYFAGAHHQGGLLLKQLRQKGANAKFMGSDSLDSAEMVKIAGSSVLGSYYTSVAGPQDAYPETAAFAKKFKQRFGKDIESFAMYGYDATLVGIKAMEGWLKANPGQKPTRTDVRNLNGFKGITGSIEFDNKGDPVKAKYFVLQFDKQFYPGKVVKVIDQQESAPTKKS